MAKKIKNKLFFLFSFKKKWLVASFLVLALLIVPFFLVEGGATTTASLTASFMMNVILLAISTISFVFSSFADWFLRLVTVSSDFVNLPYTPAPDPASGNEFVGYGWRVVRDFVNMFFIIVLIVIGLSTSLQIETYKWQKTLPRLVLVLVLVNFTPEFLGVFIDAANMMMNYFVNSLAEESVFIIRMEGLYDIIGQRLSDTIWTSWSGQVITPTAQVVIFSILNFLTGLIYALYGAAFAMRYVAIWLLVIISPFGLFCYILPATQPFFRKWWRWFLGWLIMGITLAFFLHLGEVMFGQGIDSELIMPSTDSHHGMEVGRFTIVFPLIIPLLFIGFGFFVSLSIASLGSKGLIEVFQGASGAARKRTAQLPGSNFREKTKSFASATVNAFSPGPSGGTIKTGSSSSDSSLFKKDSGSGALHRRGMEAKPSDSALKGSRRPVTEIVSRAGTGTKGATEEIAQSFTAFNESGMQDSGFNVEYADDIGKGKPKTAGSYSQSSSGGSSSGKSSSSKAKEKKCSDCGASIPEESSTCLLCKKEDSSSKNEFNE